MMVNNYEGLVCEELSNRSKNSSPISIYYGSNFVENSDVDHLDYLQSKLMALLQILRNKDEMIQIQEESLRMADMRVAELTQRSKLLQDELDRKIQEVGSLHGCGKKSWKVENSSPINEREDQMMLVKDGKIKDLNYNLAILETLYRDSFFESARMDATIDLLRSAYLEIRLMDNNRIKEADELQNTVASQKRSLNECKVIVREINEVKSEVSRVANKIDNDVVLWEKCIQEIVTNEVSQELQDMKSKLLQLKNILLENNDAWSLEMENKRLQDTLENYTDQNMMQNERISNLTEALEAKEACFKCLEELLERKQKQLEEKESEKLATKEQHVDIVAVLTKRLQSYESRASHNKSLIDSTTQENIFYKNSVEGLKEKLNTTKSILKSKDGEIEILQIKCKDQEHAMKMLKDELNAAQLYLQENSKLRNQLIMLTNQVVHWQNQLSEYEQRTNNLEMKLVATQAAYNDLQKQYRNKTKTALWLEVDLSEASSRGAELCAESRQVVCGVRSWMQKMRHEHQHLALKIKELQQRNQVLKLKLRENQHSASTLNPSFSFSSTNSIDELALSSRRQPLVGAVSTISEKQDDNLSTWQWIDAVDNVAKSLQGNNNRWRHKLDQHRSHLGS